MKGLIRTAIVFVTVAYSTLASAQGPMAPPDTASMLEKVTLGDGIYLFRAPYALDLWTSSNSLVVVNDSDVVVFDSNARTSVSRRVIAEIRKITSKPVRVLINSHWHMDHWLGNAAYADAFPGLQIISTTETRDYMLRLPMSFFLPTAALARARAVLDTAITTGRMADGAPLTTEARQQLETSVQRQTALYNELSSTRQVLPTVAFRDTMRFWRGGREFLLFSATGDATGSAVLYLPRERLLATGDVLARQANGEGAQPWTTNSYKIADWLSSLRALEAMDLGIIVPGQGPVLRDKEYLRLTIAMYESITRQVHAALEKGAMRYDQVLAAVNLTDIRQQFTKGDPLLVSRFDGVVQGLIRRVVQEARDGIALPPEN